MKIHKRVLGTITLADTKHRDDFIEIKDTFQVIANFIALEIEHQQTQMTLALHSEIARNIAEGVYLIKASDGVIAFANPKFEEMFGYDPGELVGKHVSVVNAPSEKSPEETTKEIIKSLKKNGVWKGEIKNIKKSGALFWSHATVSTFKHKKYGTVWVSIHEDITDHKRSEIALQKSREQLQAIIDNTTAVIYIKDIKGKYILINSRYEDLFHTTREEIIGKTDFDIFPKDMAEAFQRNDRKVSEKRNPVEFEEYAPHDDGLHSYISIKFPLFDFSENIYGVCGISTDITERKKAEIALKQFSKKLVENQELERKRIASELHDSLAQNMMVINNEIQKIISNSPKKTDERESLEMASSLALQTIDDIDRIVNDLHPHQLDHLGLTKAVKWLAKNVSKSSGIGILTKIDIIPEVMPSAIEIHIYRIIQEGINNIVKHSIASKGRIELNCLNGNIDILISDDGKGFEFNSTDAKNTIQKGFGLQGIEERAKICGGTLTIDSHSGKGTILKVTVPVNKTGK